LIAYLIHFPNSIEPENPFRELFVERIIFTFPVETYEPCRLVSQTFSQADVQSATVIRQ
jgi:hypothetical protein